MQWTKSDYNASGDLANAYEAGVDAYWSGEAPEGWESKDALYDPYLAGWLHASHMELNEQFFAEDGE